MKKRKREEVEMAYNDWLSQPPSDYHPSSSSSSSSSSSCPSSFATSRSELMDTFKVLLARAQRRTHHGRTVVLLLHEDYPHELQVFGPGPEPEPIPGSRHAEEISRVVCVMGAVRDMYEEEERALLQTAASMRIDCVGANLGRTAEFTSKITTALNHHARTKIRTNAGAKANSRSRCLNS